MQVNHLYNEGLLPELPLGTPFNAGTKFYDTWGYLEYGYGPYSLIAAADYGAGAGAARDGAARAQLVVQHGRPGRRRSAGARRHWLAVRHRA